MEENVTGSGARLGKRPSESGIEVDFKTKAGTAWSHNYLNQKPWHPLSYPNQRRKWIAEQTHATRTTRAQEVAREFAQEQEFFRQTALFSKKEKEKVEIMQAVSFMYVRPPGYNAESAKAAEDADEQKRMDPDDTVRDPANVASSSIPDTKTAQGPNKPRPKDVFGRALPTENEFDVLKNAPRLETGMPVRNKPFGVEIRNVRCVRCNTFGHQSGDRECPLKDAIMPNEESRLKRDDPLTAIKAQTESSEPLKWELKQKPGLSPPRGGFRPDDPNQQIVAEDEDIFDEYGGFLSGGDIPSLLFNYSASKSKKKPKDKKKHKHRSYTPDKDSKNHNNYHGSPSFSDSDSGKDQNVQLRRTYKKHNQSKSSSDYEAEVARKNKNYSKNKHKKKKDSDTSSSDSYDTEMESRRESRSKHRRKHKKRYSDSPSSDSYDKELERRKSSRTNKPESRHVPPVSEEKTNREDKGESQRKHSKHHRKQYSDSEPDTEKWRSARTQKQQISKASDDSDSEFRRRHREHHREHRTDQHRHRHHGHRHSRSEYQSG